MTVEDSTSLSLFEPLIPENSFDPQAQDWIKEQVNTEVASNSILTNL